MNLVLIAILIFAAVFFWCLSGYDTKVTGQNRTEDLMRRGIRSGITLVVFGFAADQFLKGGVIEGFIAVLFVLPLAPFWIGCLSELAARGVGTLVDSEDNRKVDLHEVPRQLNQLSEFVRIGRTREAIALSRQLLQSSQVSTAAIETMLFRLYQDTLNERVINAAPHLAEFRQLREQKQFDVAAIRLTAHLKVQADDYSAAFLLMQVYAQDLRQPSRATGLLQSLARDPVMPPCFVEYARHRIQEWIGAIPPKAQTTENVESLLVGARSQPKPSTVPQKKPASVDEMLAAGQLASAIEILENKTQGQPDDFDSWMKLAEAYGVYCADLSRAGKIVDRIALTPNFSAEQIQTAKAKLKEWRVKQPA
jgi:hypothetical protein